MAKYKIAVLPGDGVGKEVVEAAKIVLDALKLDAEYIYGDIGWEFWKHEGNALPERTIQLLKETDCCLFGAITSMPKEEAVAELDKELQDKGLIYFSPIVKMRQMFDLYVNLRPCKAYPGNPLNYREDIDIVVFRENTEDLYSGVEFHPVPDEVRQALDKHSPAMKKFAGAASSDMAISLRIITRKSAQRITRAAFEYAKKTGRKSVTLVEKPNVIRETSGLMLREARKIAKEYPGIAFWEANIDAMCMWLVKNPQDYSVLCTSNMFGDIVSDLAGQLVGGLGFAASANTGDKYGVFEPVHGSAPKYTGMYKVNPIATIFTSKLMLDWLGETEKATRIEQAVIKVLQEGKVRTYDLGGKATTLEVAEAIAEKL
ncbi:MAG: isocitrate/isopropylmalate dehydrogenase family protein [bacterium]|nr:isocitrate/isopropylmalate dehydrogenase family protein [bacterium]